MRKIDRGFKVLAMILVAGALVLGDGFQAFAKDDDSYFVSTWQDRREKLARGIIKDWLQGESAEHLSSEILSLAECEQQLMMIEPKLVLPGSFFNGTGTSDLERIPIAIFVNWMGNRGVTINPRKLFEGKIFELRADISEQK